MDPEHARELLASEREKVEKQIATLKGEGFLESDDNYEPADVDSEDLYLDEYKAGRLEELNKQLAAIEGAEERLKEGTYGLSVESGEPIPDGRLEALPTAERTVEEEERLPRR